jgi:hypothetical protein
VIVDPAVAVANNRVVDIPRDNQDQRIDDLPECSFDRGGVEQAERDIQRLAEAPVGVVVHFPGMHYDAHPQLPLRLAVARQARVVLAEELAEGGNRAIEQDRLRHLVDRMNEREDAVSPVNEPVVVALVDARPAQRHLEQLVGLIPELALDGIGTAGGSLNVQRDNRTVLRQAGRQERRHQLTPGARGTRSSPTATAAIAGPRGASEIRAMNQEIALVQSSHQVNEHHVATTSKGVQTATY